MTNTVNQIKVDPVAEKLKTDLLIKYPKVFENPSSDEILPPMAGPPMEITLKEDATPVYQPWTRPIAIQLQGPADKCLEKSIKTGVFRQVPINDKCEWLSPAFFVPKGNGDVRLVTNYIKLNKHVKRPLHPLSTVNYVRGNIPHGSKVFMTLDAVKGFGKFR